MVFPRQNAKTLDGTLTEYLMIRSPLVRKAIIEDAFRIAELCRVLGYSATEAVIVQRFRALHDRPDQMVLIVVSSSGMTAGWIHGAELTSLTSARRIEHR